MKNKKPKEIIPGPPCPWCKSDSIQKDKSAYTGENVYRFICENKACKAVWSKTNYTSDRSL